MNESKIERPKVFISYSWSSPDHEQWVVDFATELRRNGVDVILDKWDLNEGDDAFVFMEQMVNDPEVKKVIIICDKNYAEKANKREGGVGIETQIISKEIYDKVKNQNKFVVVVTEKDENDKPYLPTYYKSRIYIDLSSPDKYGENFERLLRWIYDEPLYKKPEIGDKPDFLKNNGVYIGTSLALKKAISSLKEGKNNSLGYLKEYFEILSGGMEKFRIKEYNEEYDEIFLKNIEEFIPYLFEAIEVFLTIAKYADSQEYIEALHRFFESLIPYMFPPKNISYRKNDFDNFKFIIHELFLYAIAIFLKEEKFKEASLLLNEKYYIQELPGLTYRYGEMFSFIIFRQYIETLDFRNKRLKLGRLSLRSDLLKERCEKTGIRFMYLMQADFVLYINSCLNAKSDYEIWFPETLLYVGGYPGSFEIFARAESKKYFERIKCLFNIQSKKELEILINDFETGKKKVPSWQFYSFSPKLLMNFEKLATEE